MIPSRKNNGLRYSQGVRAGNEPLGAGKGLRSWKISRIPAKTPAGPEKCLWDMEKHSQVLAKCPQVPGKDPQIPEKHPWKGPWKWEPWSVCKSPSFQDPPVPVGPPIPADPQSQGSPSPFPAGHRGGDAGGDRGGSPAEEILSEAEAGARGSRRAPPKCPEPGQGRGEQEAEETRTAPS